MADVFISYSHADRRHAQAVSTRLSAAGYATWWDNSVQAGDVWSDEIRNELRGAGRGVVLWSRSSWKSRWVHAEALSAFERGNLINVRLDDVKLDVPYNAIQSIDWSEHAPVQSDPILAALAHSLPDRRRRDAGYDPRLDPLRDKIFRVLAETKAKPRVVALLGFSSTGKSFFLRRLELESARRKYVGLPRLVYSSDREKLPGTAGFQPVSIFRSPEDAFLFIDMEGELVGTAAQSPEAIHPGLVDALALADAFLFMNEATPFLVDCGFVPRESYSNFEPVLSKLIEDRWMQLATMMEVCAQIGLAADQAQSHVVDESVWSPKGRVLSTALSSKRRCSRPIMLALSKTDAAPASSVIVDGLSRGKNLLKRPEAWIEQRGKGSARLLRLMKSRFRNVSVEAISSCVGHKEDTQERQNIVFDPHHTCFGVADVFSWLRRSIDRSRGQRGAWSRRMQLKSANVEASLDESVEKAVSSQSAIAATKTAPPLARIGFLKPLSATDARPNDMCPICAAMHWSPKGVAGWLCGNCCFMAQEQSTAPPNDMCPICAATDWWPKGVTGWVCQNCNFIAES